MEQHAARLHFSGFHLEIRSNPYIANDVHRTLYEGDDKVNGVQPLTLKLLECFARNSRQPLNRRYLHWAIGGDGNDTGHVQQQIHQLRQTLRDNDAANPRFIRTIPKYGYEFLPNVRCVGDVGGIKASATWSQPRFLELLNTVEQAEGQEEDLRIVSVAFCCSIPELHLEELLARNVRIKIILTNPNNTELLNARHGLRTDRHSPEQGRDELEQQLDQLSAVVAEYPRLEVKLSDALPCGFITHSKNWAVMGMFLAQFSYARGPIIEVSSDNDLWKKLYTDFRVRWEKAIPFSRHARTKVSASRHQRTKREV